MTENQKETMRKMLERMDELEKQVVTLKEKVRRLEDGNTDIEARG